MKRFPLELQTALENLEFWVAVELRRGDELSMALATFDELARRVSDLADPEDEHLIRPRIHGLRRLVELRCEPVEHEDLDVPFPHHVPAFRRSAPAEHRMR